MKEGRFLKYIRENMTDADMPNEDMKLLCSIAGVDAAVEVMNNMAGGRFLVPVYWQKTIAEKFVLENVGKMSVKELAVATEMSEAMIYKILNSKRIANSQTTLLDHI